MTMSTAITAPKVEDLILSITEEIHVNASLETTFEALLEQLGPGMVDGKGEDMRMKVEAWPGGRWYRDLGQGNGHHWAQVQAIKRPTLLEFFGPLMLSHPVANNVQYRLSADGTGTKIVFHHYAVGAVPEEVKSGMRGGWHKIGEGIKQRAEKKQ